MKNKTISIKAIFVFAFILIFTGQKITEFDTWTNVDKVVQNDVKGYYAYLPAYFIQDDIGFKKKLDYSVAQYIWNRPYKDKKLIKYSCGVAMLQTPGFLIANQIAQSNPDYLANGYSEPYVFAITATSLFFLLIALIYCRKILLLYYSENVALLTIFALFLATNIFVYTFLIISYSHIFSVAILFIYIYYGIKWLIQPTLKNSIFIGLSLALLILIRPVDILFFPIPYILSLTSEVKLKALILNTFKQYKFLIVAIISGVIVFTPQLLYNYTISGKLLFYTYTDEGFFFTNPQFFKLLFSFRNGWLIYSPILIFAFIGLIQLYLKQGAKWILYFLVIAIYLYVISSWWCWWYVGFGNRACINILPLMSIPFAFFIQILLRKKWYIKLVLGAGIYLFISFNLFQIDKYHTGSIHYMDMSSKAYWNSFNQRHQKELFEIYLEPLNLSLAKKGIYESKKPTFDTLYNFSETFEPKIRELFLDRMEFGYLKKVPTKGINRIHVESEGSKPFLIAAQGDSLHPFYSHSNEIVSKTEDVAKVHHWVKLNGFKGDSISIIIWNQSKYPLDLNYIKFTGIDFKWE